MKTFKEFINERKQVGTQWEVMESIKRTLQYYYDEIRDDYELYPYTSGEALKEVPSKSAPGFIPFTDGGFTVTGYSGIYQMNSSGNIPKQVEKKVEEFVKYDTEYAVEDFIVEQPAIAKEVGLTKKNAMEYYDLLTDAGYDQEAEDIDTRIRESYDSDFMFELGVHYYTKDNSRGDSKEFDNVYVYGLINWEAPYYRSGSKNEWVSKKSGSIEINPNSKTFKKDLANKIKSIVKEF